MEPCDPTLVNCIDYTDEYTLFSDYFSAVALSPAPSDAAGIHRLYFKGLNAGSILPTIEPVARPFARAQGGEWEHVAALGFESRPDGWTQMGATSHYFVTQIVRFINEGVIRVSFELKGRTESELPPELGVLGAIYPEQAELLRGEIRDDLARLTFRKKYWNIFLEREASFIARTKWQFCAGLCSNCGFRSDQALPSLPPQDIGWLQELAHSKKACWWLVSEAHATEGGWSAELTISLSFEEADDIEMKGAPAPVTEAPHFDFGLLPRTEPDTLYWNRKLHQAMTTMIAAGVRHPGYGAFSSDLGLLASLPNWSSTVWFWDHFISATAIGAFRPEWMTSAVSCVLRHTSNERIGPGILLAFPPYEVEDHMVDCYAPIASWAVMKAWLAYGRRPNLEAIYPLLAGHHEGWYRHCDRDGDGIPEWRNSGNPADDSPRFDPYAPSVGAACFELPPFPSADLCAYLLLDARCLQRFAHVLGLKCDAERWEGRVQFLRQHLLARHWDPEEMFFHDRMPDGSFYKVKTFFGLLPLWADPELLPRETARAAIERHLLNPNEFWGDIPFPSVAYDEPAYDPLGYWRGRMWGHIYYWNTEILRLHGFEMEAEEARTRYLRVAACHKESMENFPSDPAQLHHRTVRSYNWCGSVTAFFLLGWHRSPVQLAL